MIDPTGDQPEVGTSSRYSLVIAVAKRAKQLREGATKLVDSKSRNPITLALEEIAAGKVKLQLPTQEQMDAVQKPRGGDIHAARSGVRETAELLRTPEEEVVEDSEDAGEDAVAEPSEQGTDLLESGATDDLSKVDSEPEGADPLADADGEIDLLIEGSPASADENALDVDSEE